MRLRACLFVLFAAQLLCNAYTYEWSYKDYPNPNVDLTKCGRRGVKSWVCDPDGLISYDAANIVEGVIKDIKDGRDPYATARCGSAGHQGYEVAIALVRKMRVPDGYEASEVAKTFARRLHDAWGVGLAECNNGVLLLLAVDDRQVYISTGKGAKKSMSNAAAATVINRMKPLLRSGELDTAVEKATREIGMSLAGAEFQAPTDWAGTAFTLCFFGAVGFVFYSAVRQWWTRRHDYARCRDLLEKLKREQREAVSTRQYPTESCPVCLEDFDKPATPSAPPFEGDPAVPVTPSAPPYESDFDNSPAPPFESTARAGSSSQATDVTNPLLSKDKGNKHNKSDGATEAKKIGAPIFLPCGHSFCESCLKRVTENQVTCPICRTPMTDSGDNATRPSPQQPGQPGPNPRYGRQSPFYPRRAYCNNMYADELHFRLLQLQHRYPYYIGDRVVYDVTEQARRGRPIEWERVLSDHMRDQADRQRLQSSGMRGTHNSFGGGNSSGGGGAGGSW